MYLCICMYVDVSYVCVYQDFDQLWTLLLEEHIAVPIGEGDDKEGMWLDRIISGFVGDMKENRKAAVIKVCMT